MQPSEFGFASLPPVVPMVPGLGNMLAAHGYGQQALTAGGPGMMIGRQSAPSSVPSLASSLGSRPGSRDSGIEDDDDEDDDEDDDSQDAGSGSSLL